MKIWFDILTPKQVKFFAPAVDSLKKLGHNVLCTTREYREATELARINKLEVQVVGKHGGSTRAGKLIESTRRAFELGKTISNFDPYIAISFSSPEASRVAFGLGIRHLAFNDSPHAEAVARLSVPLVQKLFCPWIIPYSAWVPYGIKRTQIRRYRALDPAAWLKRRSPTEVTSEFHQNGSQKPNILIRVEESKASYIADKKLSTATVVDEIVKDLAPLANLHILARYQDQIAQIEYKYAGKAHILRDVVEGTALLSSMDIFIGAGGTMTAEAALMGLPTISIAPLLYYTDRFLIREGLVRRATESDMVVRSVKRIISDPKIHRTSQSRARSILQRMEDPIKVIVSEVEKSKPAL